MNKKYIVRLTTEERDQLKALVSKGKGAADKMRRAHILLAGDADGPGRTDEEIAAALSVHSKTVSNVRRRFVEEGLEAALNHKMRETPPTPRKLDGAGEARLIAVACSAPPEGRTRWTLRLLADKLVELEVVDCISYEAVRQTLKKTNFSRTAASTGASRPARTRRS
jgi:transposase